MEDHFLLDYDVKDHPVAAIMPMMTDEEFEALKEDLLGNGLLEPIILFQDMIIDGRNRYKACREIGIDVFASVFPGGMDLVEYVVSKNIHRRHLTEAQKAVCAAKAISYHADEAKERQRAAGKEHGRGMEKVSDTGHEPIKKEESGRSDEQVGKLFDVSGRSVARAKYVMDHGTEEEKKDIETGKAALKPVEKQVRERVNTAPKPKAKSTFNPTTDSVEWAKSTWNPVTGCLHDCAYCYARDITKRYPENWKNGFEPTFHPERLEAPFNTKLPASKANGARNVFVCSMADLFGEWVDADWIQQVLHACEQALDWTFIFLTKNPKRLIDFHFPENAWVGTTVDVQERVAPAVSAFMDLDQSENRPKVLFLSCEPMLERLDFGDDGLMPFDWVIIGGCSSNSGMTAIQPAFDWVFDLTVSARKHGCKVYWKPNLKCRPQEYPVTE